MASDGTTFSCILQLALKKEEKENEKDEKKQAKVKRTLRRFFGRVFVLPDAQGRCGFTQIRGGESRAGSETTSFLPFSAGVVRPERPRDVGGFVVGALVWKPWTLVAQRCVVRGLASPHSTLDAVRWEIWTFFELRATGSSCSVSWCPLEMYMNIGSLLVYVVPFLGPHPRGGRRWERLSRRTRQSGSCWSSTTARCVSSHTDNLVS